MAKLKTESAEPKTQGDLRGHNTRTQLLSYVERFERLQEERDALGDDQKEIMGEAKELGFDTKIIRKVIQRRKMDAADRMEADALLETYEEAVRDAEKQQVAKSVEEGGAPPPPVALAPMPPAPKKGWLKPKPAPVVEPDEDEVQATAAAEIGHAADHPEREPGKMPSFLRRT